MALYQQQSPPVHAGGDCCDHGGCPATAQAQVDLPGGPLRFCTHHLHANYAALNRYPITGTGDTAVTAPGFRQPAG